MYGAILGDIIGSKYEFCNAQSRDFPLFSEGCSYTDDSLMTLAIANALLRARAENRPFRHMAVEEMQRIGRAYPWPQGGYGSRFGMWLHMQEPAPYHSCGNGSAMRVSACGVIAGTLQEALDLARASADVTHDHPEGIKGAQAVAAAIYLAAHGEEKTAIRDYIRQNFYPLDKTLRQIRPNYRFDETCQGTVPEAIEAFLESHSFEDAIRNAIWLGGDSDTVGAITGSIAWAYYSSREDLRWLERKALEMLPEDLREIALKFASESSHKGEIPL